MSATKELKQKIKSVASLQKITKAMEMIARAKMKRYIDEALGSRSYAMLALELLDSVSTDPAHKNIYLSAPHGAHSTLVLYIASDKGLCGSYNAQIFKQAEKYFEGHFKSKDHSRVEVVTVGRNAYLQARKLGFEVTERFDKLNGSSHYAELRPVADLLLEKYRSGNYKKVVVVYSNFISIFNRETVIKNILPLKARSVHRGIDELGGAEDRLHTKEPVHRKEFSGYLYEPSAEEVFDTVVPELVSVAIFQTILESRASEESARMVAMKTASDNSEKLGAELNMIYNRARQAQITKEIIEIAAGNL